jgi:hypothetical protein
MPYCNTKQRCDDMWGAPAISDCVNTSCMCTGGSQFVESLLTCQCRDDYVVGNTGCLPGTENIFEMILLMQDLY